MGRHLVKSHVFTWNLTQWDLVYFRNRPFQKLNGQVNWELIFLKSEADRLKNETVTWYETIRPLTKALHERYELIFSEPEWTGSNTNDLTISKHTARFRNQKQHLQRQTSPKTVPETVMGRHDRCHDMMFYGSIECFWIKTTRHGRRHKSVWDPSRRVWEAMTTGFGGSTRGSRTHRFCSENGDERQGRMAQPSVVFREQTLKVALKVKPQE